MITAISAGRLKRVRSDSSPSTTSQPSPAPPFEPSWGTGAPISHAGSLPVSRGANAIIAAVVPFPCVPPTTRSTRRSPASSARNSDPASGRAHPDRPTRRRSPTSGGPDGSAGDLDPDVRRACKSVARGTPSAAGPSRRPRPPTRAQAARTPTSRIRRSRRTRACGLQARASATSPSAISSAAFGRATRSIASPIRSSRGSSSRRERMRSGTSSRSRSRIIIAPPACTK